MSALTDEQLNDIDFLREEVLRLRKVEKNHKKALKELGGYRQREAWAPLTKYALVKLGQDMYVPWSNPVDAPASQIISAQLALKVGFDANNLKRADSRDHTSTIRTNRAGPGEVTLTAEALIEAYAEDGQENFRLTPDKVVPRIVDEYLNAAGKQVTEWTPWAPDAVPEKLPEGMKDRL